VEKQKQGFSRRGFVGVLSSLGLGAIGLVACGKGTEATAAPVAASGHQMAGMPMAATPVASAASGTSAVMTADEMDKMHEAGIKAFPAKTAGLGGRALAPRMEGEFKVFDLVAKKVQWEVEPGKTYEAWGYNGVIPGPELRVTEGDKVRVVVKNELAESTAVHFHGQMAPNAMDGVPFITQPPIKPGTNFTYEFVAKPAGTHMYHSHHNATKQVGMGCWARSSSIPKTRRHARPSIRNGRLCSTMARRGSRSMAKGSRRHSPSSPSRARRC
jgi:FtsP/CotA-like multicopper oxidase with cupredoxin domain